MDTAARVVLGWLAVYTYPVVFVGTLIDASGIPFPGRLLLVAAGALAGTGRRSVAVIVVLGAVAAMIMDHVWYLGGVWGSERLLRFCRRFTACSAADSDIASGYFTRYGAATIVVGRFFTSVRALAWPVAAAHGVGYPKFLLLDLVGAGLWSALWVLLGWMVGDRWASAAETAGVWMAVGAAILVVLAAAPVILHLWRRRRARRATDDP